MTHRDQILDVLRALKAPICDDCLSDRTGIRPRQTVNQRCRQLESEGNLSRSQDVPCHLCRGLKICNRLRSGVLVRTSGSGGVGVTPRVDAVVAELAVEHDDTALFVESGDASDATRAWHWEGHVQSALVRWLVDDGWTIEAQARTATKEAGKDIIACRDSERMWVSVKGYPAGTARTNPSTQARHWFCHGVFDLVLYRDEDADVSLALGLPAGFVTYHRLAQRTRWLQRHLPFRFYWVAEDGAVVQEPPGARLATLKRPSPGTAQPPSPPLSSPSAAVRP